MCKFQYLHGQVESCRVPLPKEFIPQRYWSWSESDRIPEALGKMSVSPELHWPIFREVLCTGWNNCS